MSKWHIENPGEWGTSCLERFALGLARCRFGQSALVALFAFAHYQPYSRRISVTPTSATALARRLDGVCCTYTPACGSGSPTQVSSAKGERRRHPMILWMGRAEFYNRAPHDNERAQGVYKSLIHPYLSMSVPCDVTRNGCDNIDVVVWVPGNRWPSMPPEECL